MAHLTHNDLRPWYRVHTRDKHVTVVVATDQVILVCTTCALSMSVDAIDAGSKVKHED